MVKEIMAGATSIEIKQIFHIYENLNEEWRKEEARNLDKCGAFLSKLKIELTKLAFMPTSESATPRELLLARDILEIGALWSIEKQDITSFERYFAQLKSYYFDFKSGETYFDSPYKHPLIGLNLLCLLSQNRLAEFHTELELLSQQEIQNNPYILHPTRLEHYLMEGSYNKVFLSRDNVPAKSYKYFIDILIETIRDDIGSCIEKSYESMEFGETARMLFFNSQRPMKEFAAKRGWQLDQKNHFHFVATGDQASAKSDTSISQQSSSGSGDTIAAAELTQRTIQYAREMEMIV